MAISSSARTVCPGKGSSGSQGVRNIQGGQDVAVGPQGRRYGRTWQIGVFHPTEVAHRVFPPPTVLATQSIEA